MLYSRDTDSVLNNQLKKIINFKKRVLCYCGLYSKQTF
jgi:hypothetical protein